VSAGRAGAHAEVDETSVALDLKPPVVIVSSNGYNANRHDL